MFMFQQKENYNTNIGITVIMRGEEELNEERDLMKTTEEE